MSIGLITTHQFGGEREEGGERGTDRWNRNTRSVLVYYAVPLYSITLSCGAVLFEWPYNGLL